MLNAASNGSGADGFAVFDKARSPEHVPDDAAQAVRNRPHCFLIAQPYHQLAKFRLQIAAFFVHRGLCGLTQQARKKRLPLAERRERFCAALSSEPGHTPIQEANCRLEAKAAAAGPISATI